MLYSTLNMDQIRIFRKSRKNRKIRIRSMFKVLQIPKSKTKPFGTFLKIDPKIRKIMHFQTAVEIALVYGFWWNLWQTKGLGLVFQKKIEILNFRWFFNVLYLFEHRPDPDFRKCWKTCDLVHFWAFIQVAELFFFKIFFFASFSSRSNLKNVRMHFL